MHNNIKPCYIEGGQNIIGRVTTRITFDIMYSEMRMDYLLFHSALQDIKWLELHYIVGGRTSSTETVDISIGTDLEWYCVVISLTSIVIILSLKTISVVFLVLLLSPMSLLFSVMNIIIIKNDIIDYYYHYY